MPALIKQIKVRGHILQMHFFVGAYKQIGNLNMQTYLHKHNYVQT